MAAYIRKLGTLKNIDNIRGAQNIEDVPADAVTSEFRTKNNTLSIWRVADKAAPEHGILAIALSSSVIEAMDFVLFDEDAVNDEGLSAIRTDPGKNPYLCAAGRHFDISDMRLRSLSSLCLIYKNKSCIIKKTKKELRDLIETAYDKGRIDLEAANDGIRKDLKKFGIA